ncbi:putative ABC transporter C family member 15 [Eucalyptus grandis]|uniref:putative ABC transporter C family member 15 n=1 Tax=Eucalyptus grandis TaxID=71139 RepID=UPI00192F0CB4|nr:putative ABC transporter C family member 15 [Eucalyptus grandis]
MAISMGSISPGVSGYVNLYIALELVNVVFGFVLVTWVLMDIWKQRRYGGGGGGDAEIIHSDRVMSKLRVSSMVILLCSVIISMVYGSFCVYRYWVHRIVDADTVSWAVTWILASFISYYARSTIVEGGRSKWPLVLILWWVYFTVFCSLSVSSYLVFQLRKSKELPPLPLRASTVEIVSLPFSLMISLSVVVISCTTKPTSSRHLNQPLLQKEVGTLCRDLDGFDNAGFWSRLTFQWLNPLFCTGRKQKLESGHIPPVSQSERAEHASSLFEESLKKQKFGPCSLLKAIGFALCRSLAINGALAGINTLASYMGPLLINSFVNFLSSKREDSSYHLGLVLAFMFLFSKTIESLTQRQWYFGAQRIAIRVRAGLMALIYMKCQSMRYAGLSNGKIVNLINVDVEKMGDFCSYVHEIWLVPVQVLLALVILYRNLGAAPTIAALSSTIFVMVSNTPLVKVQKRHHSKIMEAKDARMKVTSETLKSMRVLKLHSWEPTFLKKILQLREMELSLLKRYLYTCSAVAFLFWASPTLVSVATFGTCIFLKVPLSAGTVLSALATFRILQEPIYNLPELISMVTQTKVSIDRVQQFLIEEDRQNLLAHLSPKQSDVAVEIEAGEYTWGTGDGTSRKPTVKILEKINIMEGYNVAVCGSVGSGKSSLLCCLLDEIPRTAGEAVRVNGTKAYVPQSAWIQTGSVRENILFGRKFDSAFYEDVVESCAMKQDIGMWSDGDLTAIGERGINLSGGQKQRIQLARAVYSDSDIYFLDDPFSAVDAHTRTHLYEKCLMQMLSRKTVIYSTHQLELLDAADLILVMKDGCIVQSGKYEDLIADPHGELAKQLSAHRQSVNQVNPAQEDRTSSVKPCQVCEIEIVEENSEEHVENKTLSKKTQEEESETGRVKWSVYSNFVTYAYKGALVPIILLCQVLFQGLQMASNYWIAWATEDDRRTSREKLIGVFILLSGGSSIFILGRAVLLSTIAIKTAQHLFHVMISSVFRAPISFFDSTPSSRILDRSSTDQSRVDTDIPYRLAGLVFALIQLLSIIVLMSLLVWQFFFLFLVILAISMWYQAYYITTARELARMVGIQKAPILHHFSEAVTGAALVRCFNREDDFLRRCLSLIDDYSQIVFHNSSTMEWLSVRINFLFNFGFFIVLIILVSLPRSVMDPSLAGLVATYGLNLNVIQAWVIWNLCNVENKMISVERILQFTNIQSEAPLVIEDSRPDPEWPNEGKIELQELSIRYAPSLPVILKEMTCTFPGERKIGIVGRTGSGKSTLIQALFRVVEPSGGRILIDGVDICKIGLQDLRLRLSIIPQDPILFEGSVRRNLDPLEEHSDQEIWEVLNKCHVAEMVRQDPRLLDAPVAEDGENWSVGQRQLACLARVLLKKRRILVLDEATASVDTATDNQIQKTIREETGNCTIITIAHRIPTIIDNDLVLVLDEGKIVEYDSPKLLLENKFSSFSNLAAEYVRRSSSKSCLGDLS